MANLKVLDGAGDEKYLSATGSGANDSPFVVQHEMTQATHDDLNVNANLQVADADVSSDNRVPVELATSQDINANLHVNDAAVTSDNRVPVELATSQDINANLHVSDAAVSESNPLPVSVGMSSAQTFTIANAATGSAVDPVDLGANYKALVIRCVDCQYIPASTTLGLQIGDAADDTLCDLYEANDPGTIWAGGNLPTSGTARWVVTHGFAARRVRCVLSQAASGGSVVFSVYGVDRLL